MKIVRTLIAASLPMALASAPARADVVQASAAGFEIKQVATVDTPIATAWTILLQPRLWWDHDHTYSDDSANLTMEATAPGCFCETIPKTRGSVEHGHIIYIQPPRMIRMTSALGPLQAEAVTGTLTVRLDPETETTTRITLNYVVGGYVRAGVDTLAPKVDEVLATQLLGLKTAVEGGATPAAPAAKPPLGR